MHLKNDFMWDSTTSHGRARLIAFCTQLLAMNRYGTVWYQVGAHCDSSERRLKPSRSDYMVPMHIYVNLAVKFFAQQQLMHNLLTVIFKLTSNFSFSFRPVTCGAMNIPWKHTAITSWYRTTITCRLYLFCKLFFQQSSAYLLK